MPLVQVNQLSAEFRTPRGTIRAVDDVSFHVDIGEVVGIVGESGSGKSVTAMAMMGLNPTPPCHYPTGEILFGGMDVLRADDATLRRVRGNDVAMVFQDPMTALNPLLTVGEQIAESLRIHDGASKHDAWERAVAALDEVGIANPRQRAKEYPHQFSGGMRQRATIAVGLACNPRLLIADEPTTALDVTVQAQVLELMLKLRDERGMAIVIITHDMGVIARVADRVLVMYGGRVVESGSVDDVLLRPAMPYTWSLLRAMPRLDGGARLLPIEGQPPNLMELPSGCAFRPRCRFAKDRCAEQVPPLTDKQPGHAAACVLSPGEFSAETAAVVQSEVCT